MNVASRGYERGKSSNAAALICSHIDIDEAPQLPRFVDDAANQRGMGHAKRADDVSDGALLRLDNIQFPLTPGEFGERGGGLSISGGGGSSSASPNSTQTFEISITPTDGTTCSNTSLSGTAGTWISLPAVSDCTPPPTKPGATLLGWATDPNFPAAIAQRQVDNGWGADETFNADGQLTGVFIPAGGATFLSAVGKLYPIWSA